MSKVRVNTIERWKRERDKEAAKREALPPRKKKRRGPRPNARQKRKRRLPDMRDVSSD